MIFPSVGSRTTKSGGGGNGPGPGGGDPGSWNGAPQVAGEVSPLK